MYVQAKERQGLPAATRSWEKQIKDSLVKALEGCGPADTLILDLWPPGRGESKFAVVSHKVYSNLLWQTQANKYTVGSVYQISLYRFCNFSLRSNQIKIKILNKIIIASSVWHGNPQIIQCLPLTILEIILFCVSGHPCYNLKYLLHGTYRYILAT